MEPLLYIGITQALFVAVFMAFKQPNKLSDKIIVVWMISLVCPLLARAGSIIYPDAIFSWIYSIRSFILTFGPFLWLYTNVLINKKQTISKQELWHFIPFFAFALVQGIFPEYFSLPSIDAPPSSSFQQLHGAATLFSLLSYSTLVLWRLKQHERKVLDHFSFLSIPITLKWLKWLTIGFVFAYMIPVIAPLLELPLFFHQHGLAFTGYIFILSFFALKQPIVFDTEGLPDVEKEGVTIKRIKENKKIFNQEEEAALAGQKILIQECEQSRTAPVESKYSRSGLTKERAEQYLIRLTNAMQQDKLYLDADLTIEKLATHIHISRHHLTQILSEHFNKNFYLYINEYRIKEAQLRLLELGNAHLTILDIAYESGFNSKSTFNSVFKKITQMTPSQYRKASPQS